MTTQQQQQERKKDDLTEGYIKTAAHSYVSRASNICGARYVEMKGKSIIYRNTIVRGDFGVPIRIGRYVSIGNGTILRPSYAVTAAPPVAKSASSAPGSSRTPKNGGSPKNDTAVVATYLPLGIGNHSQIGRNCIIEAAAVGACVIIGNDVVLSKRCILKDCVYVEDNTVVPMDMVIPPFSIVRGCPARIVGELPESATVDFVDMAVQGYNSFVTKGEEEEEEKERGL